MKVRIAQQAVLDAVTPAMVLGQFEEGDLSATLAAFDASLGGLLGSLRADGEISGKLNDVTVVHTKGRLQADRLIIVGLGKQAEFTVDRLRQAAGTATRTARKVKVSRFSTGLTAALNGVLDMKTAGAAITEAVILAAYKYRLSSAPDESTQVEEVTIIDEDIRRVPQLEQGSRRGQIIAEATTLSRDLTNGPPNVVTPTYLANTARGVADRYGMSFGLLNQGDMHDKQMGALLAVAQGADEPAVLVAMGYHGGGPGAKTIAIVGKGITFDSGGISIKPADNMDLMKTDMGGAAAVIGIMQALAASKAPVDALGIFAATDNLPSGRAYKPGDIVTASNGVTIEVLNTDAEGRMILADSLCYAVERGADVIIDMATLTGACMVALGKMGTGVMSNNEPMTKTITEAAAYVGDLVWPMPIWKEFDDQIKSDVADIKNTGGRYGGALTAAAFLQHFVAGKPWVHLDIAGPVWTEKDLPYAPKGATGMGVRLVYEFIERWRQEQ